MAASYDQQTSVLAEAHENAGVLPAAANSTTGGGASIPNKQEKTHIKADDRWSHFGIVYTILNIFYNQNPEGKIVTAQSITQDESFSAKGQCIVPVPKEDIDIQSETQSRCKTVLKNMKDYFFMPSMFRIVMVEPRQWLRVVLLGFLFVCLLQLWPVLLLFSPLAVCVFMLQAYCGLCAWDNVGEEKHEPVCCRKLPANDLRV